MEKYRFVHRVIIKKANSYLKISIFHVEKRN